MKRLKFLFLFFFLTISVGLHAEIVKLKVGESVNLYVPEVPLGYVDYVIWGCSSSSISFVNKSTVSATIKIEQAFEGYATVELVYVEKYVDNKGWTRANTYRKEFYIGCIGETGTGNSQSKAESILVTPVMDVEIGEKAIIAYQLLPEGSSAEVWSTTYPGTFFNGITHYKQNCYIQGYARAVGKERVTLYFYNAKDEKISATCMVSVYDPTWIKPESMELLPILVLSKGDDKKILPSLTPRNATTLFEWSSDNSAIVNIYDGEIITKDCGTVIVTVKTSNGLFKRCRVIVVDDKSKYKGIDMAAERIAEMSRIVENEIIR